MIDMKRLRSPEAIVCHKQHRADCGVGTVWLVLLVDGYLIDCGVEAADKPINRKAASARIAKIPLTLSQWIAAHYLPDKAIAA